MVSLENYAVINGKNILNELYFLLIVNNIMPGNSNGLQVVRAQVRFFQSVPRSEETHDLSVVKQWIG